LLLKRAAASRGERNNDDFDVLADGVIVGRIFKADAAPTGMPWMWMMLLDYRMPTHGYEPTREAAMAAFAKSWRRGIDPPRHWQKKTPHRGRMRGLFGYPSSLLDEERRRQGVAKRPPLPAEMSDALSVTSNTTIVCSIPTH